MTVNFVIDFTRFVLLRRIAGHCTMILLDDWTPIMIIIAVLVKRLNVAFRLSLPVEGTFAI